MSPDGKWIVSTVHAGMGFKHAILLIEAEGEDDIIILATVVVIDMVCHSDR